MFPCPRCALAHVYMRQYKWLDLQPLMYGELILFYSMHYIARPLQSHSRLL